MSKRGRFITLEGGEGVGKSTNMAFVEAWLTAQGMEVVRTREPGGTPAQKQFVSCCLTLPSKSR